MKKKVAIILSMIIITLGLTGCATWERTTKNIKSDFGGGLNRKVTVYDYNGKVIGEYEGKIDVQTSDNKVKFDLDGKRIVIYNAIVICEEE